MAKHKAATEVTVAPLSEKNGFELLVSKYWFHAAAVTVVVTGWILFRHYSDLQEAGARDGSWASLNDRTTPGPFTNVPTGDPATFKQLASELQGTAVGPWARVLEVNALLGERKLNEAAESVQLLIRENPNHMVVTELQDFGDDRPPRSLAQDLAETIDRQLAWEASHTGLFANPDAPADAPRVRLSTDRGDIVIALYENSAPEHAKNFLTLCEEGFYDGVAFHEIVRGSRVVAGDPNTKESDPSTWGLGGPAAGPALEENELYHFSGAVASVVEPGGESSHGSQFSIAVEPSHELDGNSVVFGTVVEGMDVVRQIGSGATDPTSPNRPTNPVVVKTAEVL